MANRNKKEEKKMLYLQGGLEIKKVRMGLLLQQDEFGQKLGTKAGTVCHWEQGRHRASLKYLRKIDKLAKENKIEFDVEKCIDKV
jgi:DNA-binding transcriptional regulator YiaG